MQIIWDSRFAKIADYPLWHHNNVISVPQIICYGRSQRIICGGRSRKSSAMADLRDNLRQQICWIPHILSLSLRNNQGQRSQLKQEVNLTFLQNEAKNDITGAWSNQVQGQSSKVTSWWVYKAEIQSLYHISSHWWVQIVQKRVWVYR